jgi:hypothetical protein
MNDRIIFRPGKILNKELAKKFKREQEKEPDITITNFIKRLIWKGLKK